MTRRPKYPLGQQNFEMLRELGCVYVDKTDYIDKIIHSGSLYYFLARPRRFGKSLFLSTLRYFFEGRRELFKGLYIDSIDWNWVEHPVLCLDLNMERYAEKGMFDSILNNLLNDWEIKYKIAEKAGDLSSRFHNVIKAAHEKTGKKVVILVDEYDKPLVGNLNKEDNFEHYREKLASIYSNFKSSAEHIRLVFLTGVSRFSRLSVFSDLNNLKDITFDERFADVCGITEKELLANFRIGVEDFADNSEISFDEALRELKERYDGYRFARRGSDIYNPWSLLYCLDTGVIDDYWNETGYPTIIAEALRNTDADLKETLDTRYTLNELKGMDLRSLKPVPLMYQTGYLTIKDYDKETQEYLLGLPNKEVKQGFFDAILPYYMKIQEDKLGRTLKNIVNSIRNGEPEILMKNLQAFFGGIGYDLKMDNENNFHNAFYILMRILGLRTRAEVTTSDGRIDLLIENKRYIYIIELKYDGTSEEALQQIEEKNYGRQWQTDGRKLYKIGANFSSKTRNIESWLIRS